MKYFSLKSKNIRSTFQSGQAVMIAIVFFLFISTTIVLGVSNPILKQAKVSRDLIRGRESLFLAEAGIEDVVYRIKNNKTVSGSETLTLNGGTATTLVEDISNKKQITTTSDIYSGSRKIETELNVGVGIAFHYGIQVGQGGLNMSNSSQVIGNAYSNGNIIGTNSARIRGTAIVAGGSGIIDGVDIDVDSWSHTIRGSSTVGGNANHSVLQNTTVTGNVVADSISSCTIGGTATYDTRSSCTVTGAVTTPNPTTFVPADILPLPISDEQIDTWEEEAESGGILSTQTWSNGTRIIGPKKIVGDLIMSGDAVLEITGTIWVTGQIRLSNTSIMRLDSSYGGLSGVVMAGVDESTTAGYIEISNSAQALGSGTTGSYILLLSQREMGSTAIRTSNSSQAAILYAGEGEIEIGNSAALKEITANKLTITNSATVTYESGLANSNFPSGPGGGYDIVKWKEIE